MPLLCGDCEELLSKDENCFNKHIFSIFTKEYINLSGKIIKDGCLEYGEWLNRFIISIVWRCFASNMYVDYPNTLKQNERDKINFIVEKMRKYLLKETINYGNISNYLLFLRNLNDGTGNLPNDISPHINHYLLRIIDGVLFVDNKSILAMGKLGPIMLLTSIKPNKLYGYPDSHILNSGKIQIAQNWNNAELNRYFFVDRPNEIDELGVETQRQTEQINRAVHKNLDRIDKTMSLHVIQSDLDMRADRSGD